MALAKAMHMAVQVRGQAKGDGRLHMAMVVTPRAQAGEVVVHMVCRPVHPADLLSLAGTYPPWQPPSLPATLGLEGMGIIHEVDILTCNVVVNSVVLKGHEMSSHATL